MPGINILIYDIDIRHAAGLRENLSELGYYVQDVVDNAGEAVAAFYASEPDLVILNIDVKDKYNAFEIAKKITEDKINSKPFIFISDDKNDSTFESAKKYKPCAYFIKPFDKYLIKYAIELACAGLNVQKTVQEKTIDGGIFNSDNLFIRKTKKIVKVPLSEIQYIEVESKYSTLFTNMGKFLIRLSLAELMEKLPQNTFIKVHRNYIVNMNYIVEFDYDECTVHLKTGSVPMGRTFKSTISEQLPMLS